MQLWKISVTHQKGRSQCV